MNTIDQLPLDFGRQCGRAENFPPCREGTRELLEKMLDPPLTAAKVVEKDLPHDPTRSPSGPRSALPSPRNPRAASARDASDRLAVSRLLARRQRRVGQLAVHHCVVAEAVVGVREHVTGPEQIKKVRQIAWRIRDVNI